jgi:MoaA/NifB/PqqE/SkfB family radical SAM enzyme
VIHYSVVGILYTRTCPLACRDCIISSSPKETDKMQQQTAFDLIAQIPDFADTVCFTGGEPMLYYNEIVPLVRYAHSLGLRVTLVTGAGWVSQKKPEIARERIRGLREAGLTALCVSWDIYHEEFCRPENALLVIDTAREIGLEVSVRGVHPADGVKPEIEQKLVTINVRYEKVPVIKLGRAETLPDSHFLFSDSVARGGCGTVLSPTIEPDGSVYACCGPSRGSQRSSPLVLGNVNRESLASILTRGREDPVLEAINRVGPFGIHHLLKEDPRFQAASPGRKSYTGMCELCLDICNNPHVIDLLRERLSRRDAVALVSAARLMQTAAVDRARESSFAPSPARLQLMESSLQHEC